MAKIETEHGAPFDEGYAAYLATLGRPRTKDANACCLLYQCGIANVFEYNHESGRPTLLFQGAYESAYYFALGMATSGRKIETRHWERAGDAGLFMSDWGRGKGEMFADKRRVVSAR